jgi:hypothetical protein
MFQKSTNTLIGWVVEKIGGIPGTVAPSFGSKKEQVTARHQYIIPDVARNVLSSLLLMLCGTAARVHGGSFLQLQGGQ